MFQLFRIRLGPPLEDFPHDLPAGKLGNFVNELDPSRQSLVLGHLLGNKVLHVPGSGSTSSRNLEHDICPGQLLAMDGDADYRCIGDILVLEEHGF